MTDRLTETIRYTCAATWRPRGAACGYPSCSCTIVPGIVRSAVEFYEIEQPPVKPAADVMWHWK
jgi:hypothetical protein